MKTDKTEQKQVMTEEMAMVEIHDFLKLYIRKPVAIEKVAEEYPNMLQSVIEGNLLFKDGVPEYTLIFPAPGLTVINFKTRVSPGTAANLAKGIDFKTNAVRYSLVLVAYITGFATVAELEELHKFDYDTLREVTTVFS